MKSQITCKILAALLLGAMAVQAMPWGPDTFPDPKRDVNLCGRRGKSSNICDPDGVISFEGADRVEGIIKDIWDGVDPYKRAPCGDEGIVAVALMHSMDIHPGEVPGDAAHRIAKALHAKWGVGLAACDNGVLLLLSVSDRQVYISTGTSAQAAMSNSDLEGVISAMKPKLRTLKFDEAVEGAVVDIGLFLAGRSTSNEWEIFPILFFLGIIGMLFANFWKSIRERRRYRDCRSALQRVKDEQEKLRTKEWSKPRTCPICLEEFSVNPEIIPEPSAPDVPGTSSISDDPSAPLLPSESGNALRGGGSSEEEGDASTSKGAAGPSSSGLRRRNSGKMECGHNHGTAAAGGKKGGSDEVVRTPITLRCGHTFCEACLGTWLDRAITCPICRDPVDGGDGAARPAVRQQRSEPVGRRNVADDMMHAELMFRLTRLRDRYPSYITPGVYDTWRDEAARSGTFNFETAREFQLNDPAVRAQHEARGSSGNSMSFGGGSGGGGGAGGSW